MIVDHPHKNLFSLREIRPGVFHLQMDSRYDLAMHFLRYQEYYESPVWRKKTFTLLEYMKWYSERYGQGAFTYPRDWKGFNIPEWAVYEQNGKILDSNYYDLWMFEICQMIKRQGHSKFYLIGTSTEDGTQDQTLQHEIAHAYYYLYPYEYAREIQGLLTGENDKRVQDKVGQQIKAAQERARSVLYKMGYHKDVVTDEIQAYFAAGPCKELEDIATPEVQQRFQDYFRKFDQFQLDQMSSKR